MVLERLHRYRNSKKQRIDVLSILLAVLLVAWVGFQHFPCTPDGVQCPTAPVQTVLKPLKAQCGCIVGFKAVKPKPGDKGFVQCRCAEKKSAEHTLSGAPKVDLLAVRPPALNMPVAIMTSFEPLSPILPKASISIPPRLHPPAMV
jgi:hypothetical protein